MTVANDDRPRNERIALDELSNAVGNLDTAVRQYDDERYIESGVLLAEALDNLYLSEGEVTSYYAVHTNIECAIRCLEDALDEVKMTDDAHLFMAGYDVAEAKRYARQALETLLEDE